MLQPVASTVPVTGAAGSITAAVRLMPSRTNPVAVHVVASAPADEAAMVNAASSYSDLPRLL
jgi:hypothetical protein